MIFDHFKDVSVIFRQTKLCVTPAGNAREKGCRRIFQNPPSLLLAFFITWLYTGPYPAEELLDNWFVGGFFQMTHTEKQTHKHIHQQQPPATKHTQREIKTQN